MSRRKKHPDNQRSSQHDRIVVEKATLVREMEQVIAQSLLQMQQALDTDDDDRFRQAAAACRDAQLLWLQVAQEMSPEKAHAVVIGSVFAGEVQRWMEERRPGPPPTVLDVYTQR